MYRNIFCAGCFILMCCPDACAQHDSATVNSKFLGISAGLGVSLVRPVDVVDYINSVSSSAKRVDDFGVAAEFFGTSEFRLDPEWGVKLEYAYLVKSYTVANSGPQDYIVSFGVHMPEVLVQYLEAGKGYVFKFGGGIGYCVSHLSLDYGTLGSIDYTSRGVGMKVEAEANTQFDEHLFGVITGDIRSAIMSEIKDANDNPLVIPNSGKHVKMNFLSLGLKFGMIYYF